MNPISEDKLQEIVKKVVTRSLGRSKAVQRPATSDSQSKSVKEGSTPQGESPITIALGADHGGFDLKEILKKHLTEKGFSIVDCGTNDKTSVDYPDFAQVVALKVASGQVWRGIMIDGAGIGSCMAANKVPGVRAAMCYDYASAMNSREHNDANLLTLGAGLIGVNQVKLIVDTWLACAFGGDRHTRRVEKIMAIEKQYTKQGG